MSLRLREIYESQGLSRKDVAEHMRLSENFIYKLERGIRNVNGDQLKQLASFLKVTTDQILGLAALPQVAADA